MSDHGINLCPAIAPDEVADLVLGAFDSLPAKFKPRDRAQGKQEWVPLSGFVLNSGSQPPSCVALATGMKCLPKDKVLLAHGTTLHDWHAEVLAIRAFNHFLIQECHTVAEGGFSPWIERLTAGDLTSEDRSFRIKEDVRIHMYCSEAPCGDASMELIMNQQEDASPWDYAPAAVASYSSGINSSPLHGRGYFSQLGVLRTKPSRPDSPITLSKSCTDKLTLKQCTSLLSGVTSLLIAPGNAYLYTLILPESQYVDTAIDRAFRPGGRMAALSSAVRDGWESGYSFTPFNVVTTSREFAFSKASISDDAEHISSNISALWNPYGQEVLIGGVRQGRKQFDARGASSLCRKSMWRSVTAVLREVDATDILNVAKRLVYADVKGDEMLAGRRQVKRDVCDSVLKGWTKNGGDDKFGL